MIRRDRTVHTLFDLGLVGKAIDGAIELAGGFVLLFVSPDRLAGLMRVLVSHELGEDPDDAVAHLLLRAVRHVSADTRWFAAAFLLWHGAVKVGLVVALFRRRRWAYPVAIAAFAAFLAYQGYRYAHTRSPWLLVVSVLDVFVILLTWLESRRLRTGLRR
ncbi:MAG: DUF2127 domain-containing protein [Vicinamibacterales bacterium]